jgi:hypothetical protein
MARGRPAGVLLDPDDTLILDVTCLTDPASSPWHRVRARPEIGARGRVVGEQSGAAAGGSPPSGSPPSTPGSDRFPGPFETRQVRVHADGDARACRKPRRRGQAGSSTQVTVGACLPRSSIVS